MSISVIVKGSKEPVELKNLDLKGLLKVWAASVKFVTQKMKKDLATLSKIKKPKIKK